MWDFPHFVKAREIYLFICSRERSACHVVSIWRSVSREHSRSLNSNEWCYISDCTAAISLLSCGILENLYGIVCLFPGDFCFQGMDKSADFVKWLRDEAVETNKSTFCQRCLQPLYSSCSLRLQAPAPPPCASHSLCSHFHSRA